MAEYNLSEFRANTRKAFDEAERGEPVYIERYGEDFILMSKKNYGETFPNVQFTKTGDKVFVANGVDPIIRVDAINIDVTPTAKKNNSDSQANKNNNELPGVEEL